MTNLISGQKTGGQDLVGGLDCTVHRNFFGSQVIQEQFILRYIISMKQNVYQLLDVKIST